METNRLRVVSVAFLWLAVGRCSEFRTGLGNHHGMEKLGPNQN
jgi:hypothetical protein